MYLSRVVVIFAGVVAGRCGRGMPGPHPTSYSSKPTPFASPVLPAFIALLVAAVLLVVVYVRGRGKDSAQQRSPRQSKADKLDTRLGEFRDMREALRPLEHARTASRRDPRHDK